MKLGISIIVAASVSACATGAGVPDDWQQDIHTPDAGASEVWTPTYPNLVGDGGGGCSCVVTPDAQGNLVGGTCENGVQTTICGDTHYWWTCTPGGWIQDWSAGQCDLSDAGENTCACPDKAFQSGGFTGVVPGVCGETYLCGTDSRYWFCSNNGTWVALAGKSCN